ncbi:MAG: hypothetical protein ACRBFS_12225 [Aureispira sp.]
MKSSDTDATNKKNLELFKTTKKENIKLATALIKSQKIKFDYSSYSSLYD